mmetsp:Transcript_4904/g.14199  ORF Transcript_4904/g.14199 Transcript_4904/m.14199 type:complete len:112 (+) Transcript_4904:855-1190(+)
MYSVDAKIVPNLAEIQKEKWMNEYYIKSMNETSMKSTNRAGKQANTHAMEIGMPPATSADGSQSKSSTTCTSAGIENVLFSSMGITWQPFSPIFSWHVKKRTRLRDLLTKK